MAVVRSDANPILSPGDLAATREDLEVMWTLNPGAVRFEGDVLLLVRVGEKPREANDGMARVVTYDAESDDLKTTAFRKDDPDLDAGDTRLLKYRGKYFIRSLSHLRIARSKDGRNFTFDPSPALFPSTPYESFGCEDPRIVHIDGKYFIVYSSVSERGVTISLASTEDFQIFKRHGVIFPPYNKDVAVFPRKIRGKYVCRHRPHMSDFNDACIWTAYSPDMYCWGYHEMTLAPRPGTWEAERVGCGAPPIHTAEGWLDIYHACGDDGVYRLGAMLSDLEYPEKVIARSSRPVLEPQADYEITGIFGNAVFSNGLVADEDGTLTIYYGAADTVCAAAVTTIDEMIAVAKE